MIFDADTDQISRLDSLKLVQLMKRLMLAECRLVHLPLRCATVPLQITVADGGEDGRVQWSGGSEGTDYFPARFCVFQSKAQNLTESLIKAEILKKPKKGPAVLNTAVSEVLSQRGAYVVFCSHAFTGQKIEKLRKAIRMAISAGGGDPSSVAAIEIYDANRIADWVNTHPSVALWLAALHRRRSLAGFLSHEAWGGGPEIAGVPWVASDMPRFVPVSLLVPEGERKNRSQIVWTFEQAAQAALKYLAEDKVALRITGPSGFGKSRFAFQLFNRDITVSDEMDGVALIYANMTTVGNEVFRLAHDIADAGSPTILVVDECSDETHMNLADIAQRVGSRLRFVTIDVETKIEQANNTLTIRLEPAADHMIGEIARAVAPNLSSSDTHFIQEFAKGFPKMAVLAAQQSGTGRQAIRTAEQVLDRVVWGRRQRNDEAQKALECLSLFEWVGLTGRVAEEGTFIAQKLAGIAEDAFVEHIKSFDSRGIIIQRGDFVQVTPIPLAARLGSHRLSLLRHDRLAAFFAEAPQRLKESLLKRMRWLDTSPEAKAFARKLLGAECLGNLAGLKTSFGAACLDHLVHLDPDLAMATIERIFGGLTDEELRGVDSGRRHLVWALERLAFRKESFDGAATLLRRLAAAETEKHFSNNATGQFKQLYQLYLSGTEAPPAARLLVLDDGLRSDNLKEREVCVSALDAMLVSHHFSRTSGAEEIGSDEPSKDWVPRTYGEIFEFHRAAIKRLTDIALSDDSLAVMAKRVLGSHVRGLISQIPLDDIKAMVSCIISRYGFWPEVVQEVNEWLYFDRRKAPKELGVAVRAYFDELMPSDPVELAVLYTHGWRTDFHDPDTDYDREEGTHIDSEYVVRKTVKLAEVIAGDPAAVDRALDRFVTSDCNTVFAFARRLTELVPSPVELFRAALAKAESRDEDSNQQFFNGLIAGTDGRDPNSARDCVRSALRSQKLKKHVISMIGAGKLQPDDIQLVVSLLQSRDVQPWQCTSLWMKHLPVEEIIPLLEELMGHGSEGLWASIDITLMFLSGGIKPSNSIGKMLRAILVSPVLFDKSSSDASDGYRLREVVKILDEHDLIDSEFARELVRQFLGLCESAKLDVFDSLDDSVRVSIKRLMRRHPKEVWDGVTRMFLSNKNKSRRRLERLVDVYRDDHLGPSLLYDLPRDIYLDWARRDPTQRASFIMNWLPVATRTEDGALSWHPGLEDFIAEFGNQADVLANLASRLRPRLHWGSAVSYLEPLLPLLESWSQHVRVEVRRWVREQMSLIKDQIQKERQSDDEDAVRLS